MADKIKLARVDPMEIHNSNIHRGMFDAHNAHIRDIASEMAFTKPKDRDENYYDLSKSLKKHQEAARTHLSRSREFYTSTRPSGSFEPNETHIQTRDERASN